MKKLKLTYPLFYLLFFFISVPIFAQKKPEKDSSFVKQNYELPDPTTYDAYFDIPSGMYFVYPKIGNVISGNAVSMTPDEYAEFTRLRLAKEYYKEKSLSSRGSRDGHKRRRLP